MSRLVERLAAALYEADNFLESWSDARDADRSEYRAIAAADVARHDHELAEKIRSAPFAEHLMDAYSFYKQTWPYLAGIIDQVADEGAGMTAQQFARSLQEESYK